MEETAVEKFSAKASLMEYIRILNSTESTAYEIVKAEERLFLFCMGRVTTTPRLSISDTSKSFQKSFTKIISKQEFLPLTSVSGA